jgi:polar amino acid transport system substrate-binding protein
MTNLFSPLRSRLGRLAFGLFLAPLLAGSALAQSAAPTEAVAAARALLPAKYRDAGVLHVGASTVYAPHSFFKDGTKDWTGYEIDLFNAVAEVLDIKVEYTEAPFQQLIAGVKSGRSDVSIGDLGDNDLRREQVDFIDYGLLTFQLVVDKGNPEGIKSVFDICGRDLGVVQGTTNIIANALKNCEAKGLKPANFIEFPDQTAKDQAIQSGRLPRVDIAATAVSRYKQANGLSPDIELIPSDDLGNLYIGAIVDKGNTELAEAIHAAVKVLFDNGTYAEILAKWDLSDLALKAPGVNIGQEATNWVQPKK